MKCTRCSVLLDLVEQEHADHICVDCEIEQLDVECDALAIEREHRAQNLAMLNELNSLNGWN